MSEKKMRSFITILHIYDTVEPGFICFYLRRVATNIFLELRSGISIRIHSLCTLIKGKQVVP